MDLEKEQAKEKAVHKYWSLSFIMSRVGVVAMLLVSAFSIGYFRPLYNTVDIIVVLVIGMVLGGIYVASQDKIRESYEHKLQLIEKKDTKQP